MDGGKVSKDDQTQMAVGALHALARSELHAAAPKLSTIPDEPSFVLGYELGFLRAADTKKAESPPPPVPAAPVEWTKREPADGDPFWEATLGSMELLVRVGCEFVWEWDITHFVEGELAQGWVSVGEGEQDLSLWDYQDVERAHRYCEAVARAIALLDTSL